MRKPNILLVGDLSGAGNALRAGFLRLGYQCTHIAYQNGWRKNPLSINLTSPRSGMAGSIENYINSFKFFELSGFDKIIFLDYTIAPIRFGINRRIFKHLCSQGSEVYLWLLGCDYTFHNWASTNMDKMCTMCMQYDTETSECSRASLRHAEDEILSMVDYVVPGAYEYDMSHISITDRLPVVPIPVDVSSVPFSAVSSIQPIKVLHALSREGMKGSYIIREAFQFINSHSLHTTTDIQLEIGPRLPYEEHLLRLSNSPIVIDQLFNKSLGVNSLLTLASGNALIAGNSSLGCASASIPNCLSLFPCYPQVSSVVSAITAAVNSVLSGEYDSFAAREWVQKYHDSHVVAKRFIDLFL